MLTKALRLILSWLSAEPLSFEVEKADIEYNNAVLEASKHRTKTLDWVEEQAEKSIEAYGAVLFLAGQQLHIAQQVKESVAKAQRRGV